MNKTFTATNTQSAAIPRQIDSKQLLGPDGRVVIIHEGQQYQLRQTQAGKLILTK
ncbi:hemin uptake protein HemP [Buttiauxella gaviniae]|uniref:Hemin uptake protein HemP n=1 Tax=Buttiauxella gaviniae TaxID=82990 RepID=A0ABV3NNY9_9ENTR